MAEYISQQEIAKWLDDWVAKIEDLEAKAHEVGGEEKAHYNRALEELRNKRMAIEEELEKLKTESEKNREMIKKGIERHLSDIGDTYRHALSLFR